MEAGREEFGAGVGGGGTVDGDGVEGRGAAGEGQGLRGEVADRGDAEVGVRGVEALKGRRVGGACSL